MGDMMPLARGDAYSCVMQGRRETSCLERCRAVLHLEINALVLCSEARLRL
jgi:hypothetical protein